MLHEALAMTAARSPSGGRRARPARCEPGERLAARKLRTGPAACLIGVGKLVAACEQAADLLAAHGVEVTVWDARLVAPLDAAMIEDALAHGSSSRPRTGSSTVASGGGRAALCASATAGGRGPAVVNCGVPTAYLPHGDAAGILSRLGLDGPGISRSGARAPLSDTRARRRLIEATRRRRASEALT